MACAWLRMTRVLRPSFSCHDRSSKGAGFLCILPEKRKEHIIHCNHHLIMTPIKKCDYISYAIRSNTLTFTSFLQKHWNRNKDRCNVAKTAIVSLLYLKARFNLKNYHIRRELRSEVYIWNVQTCATCKRLDTSPFNYDPWNILSEAFVC